MLTTTVKAGGYVTTIFDLFKNEIFRDFIIKFSLDPKNTSQ